MTLEFRNQGKEAALVRSSPYQWTCFLTTADERGVEVPSPWRPAQEPELALRRVLKPGDQMSIVVLANACVVFPRAGLYTLSFSQQRAQPSSLKIRVTDLESSARQEKAQQLLAAYREWGKASVPPPFLASSASDLLQLIAHTGWLEVADLLLEEIESRGFAMQGNRYLLEGLIAIPNRQEIAGRFRTRLVDPLHRAGTLGEAYDEFRRRTEGQRPAG